MTRLCANSLFCNIAIHARWIASESKPADATSRKNGLILARPARPGKKDLRRSPESQRPRRASARQWRHTPPVHHALGESRSPPKDKAVKKATLLSYAKSITWGNCHVDHAFLPGQGSCAKVTLWQGSNISNFIPVEPEKRPNQDHTDLFKGGRNSPQAMLDYLFYLCD